MSQRKIGVLLVNLGTPESPTTKDVRTYLREFLSDPRVIEVPKYIWFFILNLFVLTTRPKDSAKNYETVWTERGSPLLFITQDQAAALEKVLPENYEVVVAMRYGNPSIQKGLDELLAKKVDKIVILPLYPQYCAATTATVFDCAARTLKDRRYFPEIHMLSDYYRNPLYIEACKVQIEKALENATIDELVLSYHGMPKRTYDLGDPYYEQCVETTRLITEALGRSDIKITTVFQSKFGKIEWLKPYSFEYLPSLPSQGVKRVAVFCPGFSADCLETIEEMGVENRDYFMEQGGEYYQFIPCLNTESLHIEMMKQIIVDSN